MLRFNFELLKIEEVEKVVYKLKILLVFFGNIEIMEFNDVVLEIVWI